MFERLWVRSYDVVVGESGDDVVLQMRWQAQPVVVPVDIRRFFGESLALAQTKIWHRPDADGARDGEVDGVVDGVPVTLMGRTRIAPEGRGTTQAFDLHFTAAVPMEREVLEQVVADAVRFRLEQKFEVAWSWLSGTI